MKFQHLSCQFLVNIPVKAQHTWMFTVYKVFVFMDMAMFKLFEF